MRSKKQQQASKLNGSKSKGPVTLEGKARSSQNAITHGMRARAIVLAGESDDKYRQLQAEYFNYWQPETITETDLVNDIATSRWRLHRLLANETAVLDAEIDRQREAISEELRPSTSAPARPSRTPRSPTKAAPSSPWDAPNRASAAPSTAQPTGFSN